MSHELSAFIFFMPQPPDSLVSYPLRIPSDICSDNVSSIDERGAESRILTVKPKDSACSSFIFPKISLDVPCVAFAIAVPHHIIPFPLPFPSTVTETFPVAYPATFILPLAVRFPFFTLPALRNFTPSCSETDRFCFYL
jgi:hypothetical protein